MQLLNKLDGDFDDADVEKARAIASAVAIAVTNALLFEESELSKQHLEATLEHNNSPLLIADAEGKLLLLNHEARALLGLSSGAIGSPILDVVQPAELAEIMLQPIEEAVLHQKEFTLPDGSVWHPRIAPIPGHGRIMILHDIQSLKELEKSKDHFVAGISHDMRAPLNTISGFVSSLRDQGPLNADQEQFVERILSATEHMMNLVDGLLELAKVNVSTEHQHIAVEIGPLVGDVVQDFQGHAIISRVTLEFLVDGDAGTVLGDPIQLRRAVSNLLDNAIKYSPADSLVEVSVTRDSDAALVQVKDQGIGISDVDQPHIFEKFYRGSESSDVQGSGLGLALVQSVARVHKGEAWAENRDGNGAIFCLRLPLIKN